MAKQDPAARSPTLPAAKAASPGKAKYGREDRKVMYEQTMIDRIHRAPNAASAKAFLGKNPVSREYSYLVFETLEGNYCRAINGINKEPNQILLKQRPCQAA